MINLKYIESEITYEVDFRRISPHVVQVLGDLPFEDKGFTLSRPGKNDNWNYQKYTTLYRRVEGGIQFSDDGSVYTELQKPELEPYIPTLQEVQEAKVTEMGMMQENVIQTGIEVTLTDGTVEHFDLTEKEQRQLAVLQTMIIRGDKLISWHTSNEAEHCKYYSNEDMAKISAAAFEYVSYHETYLRDLCIYIRSLETVGEVEKIRYGMEIPEKYRSQPLKDMYASIKEG